MGCKVKPGAELHRRYATSASHSSMSYAVQRYLNRSYPLVHSPSIICGAVRLGKLQLKMLLLSTHKQYGVSPCKQEIRLSASSNQFHHTKMLQLYAAFIHLRPSTPTETDLRLRVRKYCSPYLDSKKHKYRNAAVQVQPILSPHIEM